MLYTLLCRFQWAQRLQVHDFVVVVVNIHVTRHLRFNKCNSGRFLSLNGASCESELSIVRCLTMNIYLYVCVCVYIHI
jgi:hypothetical protein